MVYSGCTAAYDEVGIKDAELHRLNLLDRSRRMREPVHDCRLSQQDEAYAVSLLRQGRVHSPVKIGLLHPVLRT